MLILLLLVASFGVVYSLISLGSVQVHGAHDVLASLEHLSGVRLGDLFNVLELFDVSEGSGFDLNLLALAEVCKLRVPSSLFVQSRI